MVARGAGIGEGAAGIVRETSDEAMNMTMAMRTLPYLILRLVRPCHSNPLSCPSDACSSHLRHDVLDVPLSHYQRLKALVNRLLFTLAAFLFSLLLWSGNGGSPDLKDVFNQDTA